MGESVGAFISEFGGIRSAAYAEGIQNEDECTRHCSLAVTIGSPALHAGADRDEPAKPAGCLSPGRDFDQT
jgi:hypothetical protein